MSSGLSDRLLSAADRAATAADAAASAAADAAHSAELAAERYLGASPLLSSSPFPFVLRRRPGRVSGSLDSGGQLAAAVHGFGSVTEASAPPPPPPLRPTTTATTSAARAPRRTPSSLSAGLAAAAAAAAAAMTGAGGASSSTSSIKDGVDGEGDGPAAADVEAARDENNLHLRPALPPLPEQLAPPAAHQAAPAPSPSPGPPPSSSFGLSLALGAVNGLVGLPTMVAFAAIVYRHPSFRPHLGALARLAFLASGLQQATFSLRSRLPYAVGQVQDVGLILLSAMATDVARRCAHGKQPAPVAVAAALWTAAAATLLVGLAVTAVGFFRLASLIQGVPLSVVGGYLGFVGAFCGVAGLALVLGGDTPADVSGWVAALTAPGAPGRVVAAFATAAVLLAVMRRARSPAALPAALFIVPLAFHALRLALGFSLADAAAAGWTLPPEPPGGGSPAAVYSLFLPVPASGVPLRAALAQIPRALALAAVVVFGSCLDVSAIAAAESGGSGSTDGGDFNQNVATVGLSNIVAGGAGAGFTGSWIFSQTLFSARAGVGHRWAHGAAIAVLELVAFAAPVSILPALPSFYVAALLLVFAAGICEDYLIRTRPRLSRTEYALLWATFIAIVGLGLEVGIAAGVAAAAGDFAFRFARTRIVVTPVAPSRASAARPPADRAALSLLLSRRAAAVSLSGYVFFGSALSISEAVMRVAAALAAEAAAGPPGGSEGEEDGGGGGELADPTRRPFTPPPGADPAWAVAWRAAPLFLLLDFRSVAGVDATAAQAFSSLARSAADAGVTLVLCHLRDRTAVRLLAAHGFEVATLDSGGGGGGGGGSGGAKPPLGGGVGAAAALLAAAVPPPGSSSPTTSTPGAAPAFDSADDAVWACEEAFLSLARSAGALLHPPPGGVGLEAALAALVRAARPGGGEDGAAAAAAAAPFFETVALPAGALLWKAGDRADAVALVLEGTVVAEAHAASTATTSTANPLQARLPPSLRACPAPPRRSHAGPGSVLGVGALFARAPRPGDAAAVTPAVLARLTRPALARLEADAPSAAAALLAALLRVQALEAAHALAVLELSAAAATTAGGGGGSGGV